MHSNLLQCVISDLVDWCHHPLCPGDFVPCRQRSRILHRYDRGRIYYSSCGWSHAGNICEPDALLHRVLRFRCRENMTHRIKFNAVLVRTAYALQPHEKVHILMFFYLKLSKTIISFANISEAVTITCAFSDVPDTGANEDHPSASHWRT